MKILIVDDDVNLRANLQRLLKLEEHEVIGAGNGLEGLRLAEEQLPGLVLSDVGMPEMDGFEFCRRLKQNPTTADIPLTFVSGKDSMEDRLNGYAAGGDDFIVKPFKIEEVLRKVKVAERLREEKLSLRAVADASMQTAETAIASLGELGVVVQFLSKSFGCGTLRQLAAAMLDALGQYGLSAAVQLRAGEDVLNLGISGANVPLEVAVLNHARGLDRVFQFGTRAAFNFPNVTVLINNMPRDDEDRCGRIRDHVALLAEGADARIRGIANEAQIRRKKEGIETVLADVKATLGILQASHQRDRFRVTELSSDLLIAMESAFVTLGLLESQEIRLNRMVRLHVDQVAKLFEQATETQSELERLAKALSGLIK